MFIPVRKLDIVPLVSLQAIVFLMISFGMSLLLAKNKDFVDRN